MSSACPRHQDVTSFRNWALHKRVRVRILKGNHDEHAAVAVAYFLLGYYRNEPRVTVDVDPSLFWWHRFGRVLLGATHGRAIGKRAWRGRARMPASCVT